MFGNKKGLERKLREQGGTIAWATIVASDEKWRSARGGDTGFGGPTSITDHMKVTLRVAPEGEPTLEVTFKQAFDSHMPRPGGRISGAESQAARKRLWRSSAYQPAAGPPRRVTGRGRVQVGARGNTTVRWPTGAGLGR
jgi:hypothetical protein